MEQDNKIKGVATTDDALTVYEVSYLLLPSLAQEQVPGKAVALKELLTRSGGEVLIGEDPVLIDLAYPMTKVIQTVRHKVNTGYFGWIKFELNSLGIEAVKKALDADNAILRYIIIKTVRENTLLEGKMKLKKEDKIKKIDDEDAVKDVPEALKEVVSEDIDKSIDDLVVA